MTEPTPVELQMMAINLDAATIEFNDAKIECVSGDGDRAYAEAIDKFIGAYEENKAGLQVIDEEDWKQFIEQQYVDATSAKASLDTSRVEVNIDSVTAQKMTPSGPVPR